MKLKIFIISSLFILCGMSSLFSQKSGFTSIQSLKLSSRMTKKLHNNQVKAFSVNKQGILKPNAGYHIVLHKKSNTIYIKLKDADFSIVDIQNNDKKEIAPNVSILCVGCETCNISDKPLNDGGGGRQYTCQGTCDDIVCDEFILVRPSEDIDIQ